MNKPLHIPSNNDALLAELKHDAQRDQWLQLWKKYQIVIVGLIALVVLATAGHSLWRHTQAQRNMALTDALYDAMRAQNTEEAVANLLSFADQHTGDNVGFMARVQAAALLLKDNKKTDAILQLEAALKDGGADSDMHKLVTLKYVQLAFDRLDNQQVADLLNPLASAGSAYRFAAWELLAVNAYRAGDQQAVRDNVEKLQKDADTPANVRVRADDLQRVLVK